MSDLFRPQALKHRTSRGDGSPIADGGRLQGLLVLGIAALAVALLVYLAVGRIARKQTVPGRLEPTSGVVKVYAPEAAIVVEKRVQEGDLVAAGQPLYVLSSERSSTGADGSIEGRVGRQLALERQRLTALAQSEGQALGNEAAQLRTRIASLRDERRRVQGELGLQREREALSATNLENQRRFQQRGYLTRLTVDESEARHLALVAEGRRFDRSLLQFDRDIAEATAAIATLDLRTRNQPGEVAAQLASVENQLTEIGSRTSLVIRAPSAGRVSGALLQPGQAVRPETPLATVLPEGQALQAMLFVPSRAIGFVKPGQRVSLRLHAFPYTRFGMQGGRVQQVSKALLLPSETPDLPTDEPAYPITVRLDAQALAAYGERWPLQAGMSLEADVVMERQRLIAWIAEPLLALNKF